LALPLHERAGDGKSEALVRLTEDGLVFGTAMVDGAEFTFPKLIPERPLEEGEQYRFHFNMTKCIGCRSCEVACNEQNGNPADILWRRIGELEAGSYPHTQRHYLSMGCNHCLDAECLKGCPVDAYKKDPVTGIVVHSTDACIGCQYCVWNCPYSVPQFNPERGVVGKCDMCKGRLEEGQEPACVNACPEGAIEIEIVNMAAWRENYSSADSPGMPPAGHTISTTRITLPEATEAKLERVDGGQIRTEHAHLSLVFMTTMMQAATGALWMLLWLQQLTAMRLAILLGVVAVAINISTFHLGRPAYAWRALKMWHRSWLSREVLLFTLFLGALGSTTLAAFAIQFHVFPSVATVQTMRALAWAAAVFGLAGTFASAAIYLVPARPSWNMLHTPIDFVLSGVLLGPMFAVAVMRATGERQVISLSVPLLAFAFAAWLLNQAVRIYRMHGADLFELRAAFELLVSAELRLQTISMFAFIGVSALLKFLNQPTLALLCAMAGVLLSRYLFFVSVVPLNMGLTFVRTRHA
jgi:DMSO reductase iron-sulfur subunit